MSGGADGVLQPDSGPLSARRGKTNFFGRFRTRLFLYIVALSLATAATSAAIYYTRQLAFIEQDRARRAHTLLASLATQAELCAYAGDAALCYVAAHGVFNEDDVLLVAVYDRRGREILRYARPTLTPPPPTPELVRRVAERADASDERPLRVEHGREGYDDLYAAIVTGTRDADESVSGGPDAPAPRREVVGIARIALSLQPAQSRLGEVLRWGAYLAVVLLGLGVVAALLISRRISRPIAALTRGAEQIRDGFLDARVDVEADDEMGDLGWSFNQMAARLRESIAALEAQSRTLEAEVARRTAEIQRAAAFSTLLNAPLGDRTDEGSGPLRLRADDLARLLEPALAALVDGSGARAGAILLSREESVELEFEVAHTQGAEAATFHAPPAAALGRTFFVDGDRVHAPLRLGGEVVGCVTLVDVDPREDVVRFTRNAAAQLAVAVGNVRAYGATAHLAQELEARNAVLRSQRDQLQQMNRLKSEFLARVSHELRTPLNAIIGYSELIADGIYGPVTDSQKSAVAGIDESGRNLLGLINQILDLSKIEAGKTTVHPAEVQVMEVVEAVLSEAAALTKDRPYRIQISGDRPVVQTDRAKLQQIVTNLVTNAIKFTPRGSVEVRIRATPGSGCTIAVADTGIGIREQDMKIIFEEFRQVDGSPTREFGGTGLGLSIARRFAELLGGSITAESEFGRGSTFTLTLPREAPREAPSPARRGTMPPLPPASPRAKNTAQGLARE